MAGCVRMVRCWASSVSVNREFRSYVEVHNGSCQHCSLNCHAAVDSLQRSEKLTSRRQNSSSSPGLVQWTLVNLLAELQSPSWIPCEATSFVRSWLDRVRTSSTWRQYRIETHQWTVSERWPHQQYLATFSKKQSIKLIFVTKTAVFITNSNACLSASASSPGVDSTLRDIRSGCGRGVRGESESSIDQWGNHISSSVFAVYPSKNLEVHRILLQATWRNVNTCTNDTLNSAEKYHVFEVDEVLNSHIQKLDRNIIIGNKNITLFYLEEKRSQISRRISDALFQSIVEWNYTSRPDLWPTTRVVSGMGKQLTPTNQVPGKISLICMNMFMRYGDAFNCTDKPKTV